MSAETPLADAWDAQLYDDRHAFVWKHGSSLIDLLGPQPGEAILDLGCGTGHLTAELAARGATVLGIDSSAEMIEQARRHYPALSFTVADARQLTFDSSFDAVFSNAALHWIPEAALVVRGVAQALKPGGRLVVEFGGRGNVQAMISAMQAGLIAAGCSAVASPWYFPSVGEYTTLLEQHGLEATLAMLFDRPTPLDGADGLRHWLTMFGSHFLTQLPPQQREDFFQYVEAALRPLLYRQSGWFADYRRLRVVAWKRC